MALNLLDTYMEKPKKEKKTSEPQKTPSETPVNDSQISQKSEEMESL